MESNPFKKHIFSTKEKRLFINISKKYENIIENKRTNACILKSKNIAWDRITQEYNASPLTYVQVSSKQLRRLWMNLKQRKRDALKERQRRQAISPTSDAVIDYGVEEAVVSDIKPEIILGEGGPLIISNPPSPVPIAQISTASLPPIKIQTQNKNLIEADAEVRQQRASQLHQLEVELLKEKINEARAKAALALDKELKDKQQVSELHELEKQLLKERIREAKAKADLAESNLKQGVRNTHQ